MSFQYFKSLLFKSTRVQQEIDREQGKSWPNRWRMTRLKKIRLAIKDRMEQVIRLGLEGGTSLRPQPVMITMPGRRIPHNN